MNLKELATEYLETDFHECSIDTIRGAALYLNLFVNFIGNEPVNVVTYSAWVKHCFDTWTPKTCKDNAVGGSRRFLKWMELHGHIDKNPHRLVKIPTVKEIPLRDPITPEEFHLLKNSASDKPPLIWAIICGWNTGMTIGDVCLLQWGCVDLNRAMISINRIGKGSRCLIPLREGGECVTMLRVKLSEKSTDWPNNPEKGISYVDTELACFYKRGQRYISTMMGRVFKKSGIEIGKSFYNLRSAYCFRLARAGINPTIACQMTGHKEVKYFQRYVTPDLSRLHDQSNLAWEHQEESNPRSLPLPS